MKKEITFAKSKQQQIYKSTMNV